MNQKKPEPRKKRKDAPNGVDWLKNAIEKGRCEECGMVHLGMKCLAVPCDKCGMKGIHACPGFKLPKPTPEDEQRMTDVLNDIFNRGKSE